MGDVRARVEVQLRDELAHLVRPLAVLVGSAETQDWLARLTGRAEALTSALLSAAGAGAGPKSGERRR